MTSVNAGPVGFVPKQCKTYYIEKELVPAWRDLLALLKERHRYDGYFTPAGMERIRQLRTVRIGVKIEWELFGLPQSTVFCLGQTLTDR